MKQSDVFSAIKAIGRELTVRKTECGEYRVSFAIPAIQLVNDCDRKTAKARNEAVAYYTDDGEDAVNTARAMHAQFVLTARI